MGGDDDVICLSSDDEIPKKKSKFDEKALLHPKAQAVNGVIAIDSRKRKSQNAHKTAVPPAKILKSPNKAVIEDIIVESPARMPYGEAKRRSAKLESLEYEDSPLKTKTTPTKTTEKLSKSNESKFGASNPSNASNARSSSGESDKKLMTLRTEDWQISEKELSVETATIGPPKSVDETSPTRVGSKRGDEPVANGESAEALEIEILESVVTSKPESSIIESARADRSRNPTKIPRSSDETPLEKSSEIVVVRSFASSRISIGNELKKNPTNTNDVDSRRNDESSEIKIINEQKIVPKLDDKSAKSCEARQSGSGSRNDIESRTMPSRTKNASPKSSNGSRLEPVAESSKASCSGVPLITSCKILPKGSKKISTLLNGTIAKTKITAASGTTASSEKHLKNNAQVPVVVVKRITPQRMPGSTSPGTNSKTKSLESSREKSDDDSKNPNDHLSEKTSSTSKITNGNNSISGDSASGSSDQSEKRRNIVDKTEIVPRPGCSKSPDNVDRSGKPQLIVKAKMPAYTVNQDTFAMFLSLCLTINRDDEMMKIVAKLKRYHDEMDPAYARSRAFEELLNEKRERISESGKERVYWHTKHVMDAMKARKIKRKNKATEGGDGKAAGGTIEEGSAAETNNENHEIEECEEDTSEARARRRNIRKIERAMKLCAKKIKKLEETEADSDDDENNSYMKLDRYNGKMIELWNKLCELTNEHSDAGRSYLRPKHFRVTEIPSVNQAINSFINSKLVGNRRKSKKRRSFIDGIIFPDYVDILECIAKVNGEQDLGLDKRTQEKMAREAFTKLGDHLQSARKEDFWDTISLSLEGAEDPATKHKELKEKLDQNEDINRSRMAAVFQEYAIKQDEAKAGKRDENVADNEDEEDEDDDEDEEENGKNSDSEVMSGLELLGDDDNDAESDKSDDRAPSAVESLRDVENDENFDVKEPEIAGHDTRSNAKNHDSNKMLDSSAESPKASVVPDTNESEVNLVKVDNEPEAEKRSLLRIRSFAKPPESWQSSQEAATNQVDLKPSKTLRVSSDEVKTIETIDVTKEDKISTIANENSEKTVRSKTITVNGKTVVENVTAISASRLIVLPAHAAPKNSSTIVDQARYVAIRNTNNLSQLGQSSGSSSTNLAHVVRISRPGNYQSQPGHAAESQVVRISRPGNFPPRLPNPSQGQFERAPIVRGQILQRIPLNNPQLIRFRRATMSENAQVPQTQIRAIRQQIFPVGRNIQTPRGILVQLKNGRLLPSTAVGQNFDNAQSSGSQQSRIVGVSGNIQTVRFSQPPPLRTIQASQVSRQLAQSQLMQVKDGPSIEKNSLPPDGKVPSAVAAITSPGVSTNSTPNLRTIDVASTGLTTTSRSQEQAINPDNQHFRHT